MAGSRTAVVVEDDADVGGLIHAILGAGGVTARLAETGTAGVDAVRMHSPDIVILDFGLPDITGLEVIRRIRSFSDVYILMLTGHEEMMDAVISAGANAVMSKPFRPRALRAQVDEALGLQLPRP
ncbi:Transcriptional regulatory protein WalR [Arthrobacter sp. Bi83]|uniref:response regulator transcription factor n=1 Tax=Arthrobacter sp. Bi83 TaxID=2822353 RepID=UPI001DF5EF96|nr:response regulator [Arthrobacter sp. Bi83]CAH0223249.1 Transcriptional regulatory protein WalR [Arthrobacter sp. Bi83]